MKNRQEEFRRMFRALTASRQKEILELLSALAEEQERPPADPPEERRSED